MAWSTPITQTTGVLITAAIWNSQIVDNLTFVSTHSHTGAAGDGAQTLGSVTKPPIIISLTTTERNALTPVAGMIIHNSTTARFEVYQSSAWVATSSPANLIAYTSDAVAPSGWTEYIPARGFCIVATPAGGTNAATVGTPFTNAQNKSANHFHTQPAHTHTGPSHSHDYTTVIAHTHGIKTSGGSDHVTAHLGAPWTSGWVQNAIQGTTASTGSASGTTTNAGTGATSASGNDNTGNAAVTTSDVMAYIQLLCIRKT